MPANTARVPTFRPGDPVCDALFAADHPIAQRNKEKVFRESAIETFPGIWSTDSRLLKFKDEASRVLSLEFPPSVDEFGRVTGNGVRSNFFGLRHYNGFPMLPATYPMADNRYLREQKGLSNTFVQDWHRIVLKVMIRLFFSNIEPCPLKLRDGSSSMMPFYIKDIVKKTELARQSLENMEVSGNLMLKGDYVTPWTNWAIGGAFHTVYRRQSSDAIELVKGVFIPKERPVGDIEFAISNGYSGTFGPASKEIGDVDFATVPGFFRERNRTAMGGPLGINACMMLIAQPVRNHIYSDYAYTFHHTTRESIQKDLREWKVTIAADVSNHDWFWFTELTDVTCEVLKEMGFAPWWVELYRVKSRMPNYVTDVAPDQGNVLLGDWRKPTNRGGLPSGQGFTDIDGTQLMTWVYFLIQVEHTYPELISRLQTERSATQVVDAYLRGKLPIRLKDKSDDALLGWTDSHLAVRAKKLQEKMKLGEQVSPYMIVTYENGGAFLGSILLYPTDKDPSQVTLIGNIQSAAVNAFSPEYGVQSDLRDRTKAKRPFPGLAHLSMTQNYGACPIYGDYTRVIEATWKKHFGDSYGAMRSDWADRDLRSLRSHLERISAKSLIDLSPQEIEVLQDPSKAMWKYIDIDLSPAILSMMFKGLPLEHTEQHFKKVTGYHG
jgi:hypothetical protein